MSEQSELFVLSIITRMIMRNHQGEDARDAEEAEAGADHH